MNSFLFTVKAHLVILTTLLLSGISIASDCNYTATFNRAPGSCDNMFLVTNALPTVTYQLYNGNTPVGASKTGITGTINFGAQLSGSYKVGYTIPGCSLKFSDVLNVSNTLAPENTIGIDKWHVTAYKGVNINAPQSNIYYGHYTSVDKSATNYGFNTTTRWSSDSNPSSAQGFNGCAMPSDSITIAAKRKGFPCGNYKLKLLNWDDYVRIYVDNQLVWSCNVWSGNTSHGCNPQLPTIRLHANSVVEVRVTELAGLMNIDFDLIRDNQVNTLAENGETGTCGVRGNQWVHFYSNTTNKYIGSIKGTSPETDLGTVKFTTYFDNSNQVVTACNDASYQTAVMQNHWVVVPTIVQPAVIKVPYSQANLNALQTASQNSSSIFDLVDQTNQNSVFMTSYAGPTNVNNTPHDNCPSSGGTDNTQIFPNVGVGTSPNGLANMLYSDFTITSFQELWLHGSTRLTPLGIEVQDLTIQCEADRKVISLTANSNLTQLQLQKSADGVHWKKVSSLTPNPSKAVTEYEISDYEGQEMYYRVVTTNESQKVYVSAVNDCMISTGTPTLFPNPSTGSFTLNLSTNQEIESAQLMVYSTSGALVAEMPVQIAMGNNQIEFDGFEVEAGTYFVSISNQTIFKPIKWVVRK